MDSCTAVDRGRAANRVAESRHGRTAVCEVHPTSVTKRSVPRIFGILAADADWYHRGIFAPSADADCYTLFSHTPDLTTTPGFDPPCALMWPLE
eukprot:567949-Prymnesium_polylepis.1